MTQNITIWELAGFFLVFEGLLSIVGSEDQQPVSQVGRIIRIGIGTGAMVYA